MRLTDEAEIEKALDLIKLKPTPARIRQVQNFGAKKGKEGAFTPPQFFMRDLDGRIARVFSLQGIAGEYAELFSTNPEDKETRELEAAKIAAREEFLAGDADFILPAIEEAPEVEEVAEVEEVEEAPVEEAPVVEEKVETPEEPSPEEELEDLLENW